MSYANAANIAAAMSRSGPPAGAKAPPRASCRRNSPHTDRRPLTRTAHSGRSSSSAWRGSGSNRSIRPPESSLTDDWPSGGPVGLQPGLVAAL